MRGANDLVEVKPSKLNVRQRRNKSLLIRSVVNFDAHDSILNLTIREQNPDVPRAHFIVVEKFDVRLRHVTGGR